MKRVKNLIIPILCMTAVLLFAREPLKEANAGTMKQSAEIASNENHLWTGDYISFLTQYLSDTGVQLSPAAKVQMEEKTEELRALMNLEGKENLQELSADGNEIAVGLLEDIFTLCGLKASFNPSGEVISLEDRSGNTTFTEGKTYNRQINAVVLLIVVTVAGVLLITCYILSIKSQTLIKDVKYDGFHKEEFAR